MILHAEGGTDGANVVLFWPDNLPEDADARLQDDPVGLIEQLRGEGKLVWFPCDGDGSYSVAIHLDEPVPAELRAVCVDEEPYQVLDVKGPGYFGGGEYVFKSARSLLDRYPHMMQRIDVPPGAYAATVWRTDISDEHTDAWLRARVTSGAMAVASVQSALSALGVICVLALLLSLLAVQRTKVPLAFAAWGTAVTVPAAWLLSRSKAGRAVRDARKAYEAAFPDYVLQLSRRT